MKRTLQTLEIELQSLLAMVSMKDEAALLWKLEKKKKKLLRIFILVVLLT